MSMYTYIESEIIITGNGGLSSPIPHRSSEVFSVLPDDLQFKKTSPRNSAWDRLQRSVTIAQIAVKQITWETKSSALLPSQQWV